MYSCITDSDKKVKRPQNPRANANIFEILTFSWTLNLFKKGRKRELDENDLYSHLNDHESSLLGNELAKKWRLEVDNAQKSNTNQQPSLLRVLIKIFGVYFMFNGMLQGISELILRVTQPMLLGGILTYFNPDETKYTDLRIAYIFASGLVLNLIISLLINHYVDVETCHFGMKMRVACCSLIFRKSLQITKTALGNTSTGQVINLLSNDVYRFDSACLFLHVLWIGPLQTIVVTYLLWKEVGVASIFGVTVLLVFIPLQGLLGKKTSKFRRNTAPKTDERIKLINEIISGIQVIKMYTWEIPFTYLVKQARKIEIQQIRGAVFIKSILQCFVIFQTKIALFVFFFSYILLGNKINATKVFVTIAYFNILMSTMTVMFPRGLGQLAEILISIKRIQNFLLYDEKNRQKSLLPKQQKTSDNSVQMSITNNKCEGTTNIDTQNSIDQSNRLGVTVSNASAKWINDQQENSLNDINLTIIPGQLVAIIGHVGAGKSSLIQAILRELPLTRGNISVCGVVSYASQKPWIFSGSVRANILFGSPMNKERYTQVIYVCALKTDLEQFSNGDRTSVGENGSLLSGGQKARIHLARAIYKQADIYLLDDPLSAVDTHVGKHLFDKCIKDYLKEKTCILVTHQVQYLTDVDQIIAMKNASIMAKGSFQVLQSSGIDCKQLLGISKKTTVASDIECKQNVTLDSLEQLTIGSQRDSYQSVLSSNNELEIGGSQAVPIEVAKTQSDGSVSLSVYFSYIAAGGNMYKLLFLFFICIVTHLLAFGGDYWISYWVNLEEYVFRNLSLSSNKNASISDAMAHGFSNKFLWWTLSRQTCIITYSILTFTMMAAVFIRCKLLVSFFVNVSTNLHNNMFNAVVNAAMIFFNKHSSGHILNHFTRDMGTIDDTLPVYVMDFINNLLFIIGIIIVVGLINIYLLIPAIIIGIFCYKIIILFLSTSRSLRRLEGISRSPVLAHINACLEGLTTVRVFEAEEMLSAEFDIHQNKHSSAWYLCISSTEAVCCLLDAVSIVFISTLLYSFLALGNVTHGGSIGLIITQTVRLTLLLPFSIFQLAGFENEMISVERVLNFTDVPRETSIKSSEDMKLPKEWPNKGKIVFREFYLRYSSDTPHVLNNLNFTIQPMEKIGIVGRTGAGKSSLIVALFRLAYNKGNIFIDGVEIHELGLHELRSKISIIPQEPVLFSGSIRTNLDPFGEYSDQILWKSLEEVELKHVINNLSDGLNSKITAGGSNFSVGQRQLICLARAIVQNNKIIILDEATSNVDPQTDVLIQNTIRNKFRMCTVLTIAHRLNTVMDSDKIIVMDNGSVVEFDHPHNLLKNNNGFLYKMVQKTGDKNAEFLHNVTSELS